MTGMTTPTGQPTPEPEPAANEGPGHGVELEPPPSGPRAPTKRYGRIGRGIIAALILAGVGYTVLNNRNDSVPDQARLACEKGVKGKLVWPAHAVFSNVSVMSSRTSPSTFTVSGNVDSYDGFGGSIPHHFTCEATVDGNTWKYRITELTR